MCIRKTRTPLHRPANGRTLSIIHILTELARSYPLPAAVLLLLLSPPPFRRNHRYSFPSVAWSWRERRSQIRWLRSAATKEATPTNAIGQVLFHWEHILHDESAAGWFKVRWFLFFLYPCWLLILVRSTDRMWNGSEKVCLLYGRCFIV
jgi:hypothetical protein